jgi:hypothetical protein
MANNLLNDRAIWRVLSFQKISLYSRYIIPKTL